jgi:hypothetical protein
MLVYFSAESIRTKGLSMAASAVNAIAAPELPVIEWYPLRAALPGKLNGRTKIF